MKRKMWKRELWNRRSRKLAKKRRCRHKGSRYSYIIDSAQAPNELSSTVFKEAVRKEVVAPKCFSLIHNLSGTADFFGKLLGIIKSKIHGAQIFIDSSGVEEVTVDALIYLIAIMENMKLNKIEKYTFAGNVPESKDVANVYRESGFIEYINSRGRKLPENKARVMLEVGHGNKPSLSKNICDFVINRLDVQKKDTQFIQKILVELMSNTYHHAYPEDTADDMYEKWYAYAENVDDNVRVIFLDTGKGITGTVRRRFIEKIRQFLNVVDDANILEYAFKPDNFIRTETNKSNRGRGLPGIKEDMESSPITSAWAFSGQGSLHFEPQQRMSTKCSSEHKIYGTIFVFEFAKGGIV